jgi:hypothetical protein
MQLAAGGIQAWKGVFQANFSKSAAHHGFRVVNRRIRYAPMNGELRVAASTGRG